MSLFDSLLFILAFDFCRFCVVIRFFHPRYNGQWPPTLKDFHTRSYPLHYFPILIIEKEPACPFLMLSAKQGNYWYHFYNVFGMTRSLTGDWTRDLPHSMPASTTRHRRGDYDSLSLRAFRKKLDKWLRATGYKDIFSHFNISKPLTWNVWRR